MSFSVHFLSRKQQNARTTANIGLMHASESFLFIFIHRVEMTMHFERTPKERHIFRHHLKKDCFLVFLIHKIIIVYTTFDDKKKRLTVIY